MVVRRLDAAALLAAICAGVKVELVEPPVLVVEEELEDEVDRPELVDATDFGQSHCRGMARTNTYSSWKLSMRQIKCR